MSATYELLYFRPPVWSKVDVILLELEFIDAKYEYINGGDDWAALKKEQKFGQLPQLAVKNPNGTVQHIWESLSIELYLGEKHGLLPTDPFEKATSISILSALRAIQDIPRVPPALAPEIRATMHETFIAETVPAAFKWHEAILEKSGGPYYAGEAVTLPDLTLLALYLRYRDIYGETNPVNANKFPKLMRLIETLLAGKLGEFVRERRDPGFILLPTLPSAQC
ncbi:hypothetical protein B0H17DRAFT_1031792 [Mycena rosella]|uniref:Glutathione S-transferase n=1 Tax=Mycena rosella TaxID=1033263 RepID=A0AAD7GZ60_MYCRO|nr:hypothetical protein B0H17DRAFT_1031792 [Mycena rosella]